MHRVESFVATLMSPQQLGTRRGYDSQMCSVTTAAMLADP